MKHFGRVLVCLLAWKCMAADEELARIARESLKSNAVLELSPNGGAVAVADASGTYIVTALGRTRLGRGAGNAEFAWAPDGKSVGVTRQGRAVEYSADGKILWAIAGSGPVSNLTVGPNGAAAFVLGHNLWVREKGKPRALTLDGNEDFLVGEVDPLYGREFDVKRHYWWSPDGSKIAFVETRFADAKHDVAAGGKLPVFRLKTVDVKTGAVSFICESDEQWPYLLRVAWHPDSAQVAFYRVNRLQTVGELRLSGDRADRTIETEKDAYWLNAPETPVWVAGGSQFVVSSERSGYRHVYLYGLDGALIRDLTPAGLEVYRLHPALDAAGDVFISGSAENRQEQHLYKLATASEGSQQLTTEPGWHEVELNAKGTAWVDRYSSSMKPEVARWHEAGAERVVTTAEVDEAPVANEFMAIETHDHVALPARLFKPSDFDVRKKYPVIVYTFSGPRGRVVKDEWGGWQMAWNRYMVGKGFLVLAVDVRGSGGYGHWFEESVHYRFGAQEVADLREVVSYLRRQSWADGARIGIWGCDYGAHTVVHAMLQFPGGFKAGFGDNPITEWTSYNAYFAERYLGLPAKRITEYDDSDALEDAKRMTGTMTVVAGKSDDDQVAELEKAFADVKDKDVAKRFRAVRLSDGYRKNATDLADLMSRMQEFFASNL